MLGVYAVYFCVSIWGLSNLTVDFKNTYFISETAYIKDYLDKQDTYYKSGNSIAIVTDGLLDFSKEKTQIDLKTFNDNLLNCKNCS